MTGKRTTKASDIMDEACLGEPFVSNGVVAALRASIESALRSAAAEERDLIQATAASDKPQCDQLHAATMVAEARTFLWSERAGPCRNCGEIKPLMEVRDCFECVMELTKLWSSSGETRRKRRRTKAPPERQGDRPADPPEQNQREPNISLKSNPKGEDHDA